MRHLYGTRKRRRKIKFIIYIPKKLSYNGTSASSPETKCGICGYDRCSVDIGGELAQQEDGEPSSILQQKPHKTREILPNVTEMCLPLQIL